MFVGRQLETVEIVSLSSNDQMFLLLVSMKRTGEPGVVFPAGLPDPFAKVVVDGSGQCHSTDTVKSTLDPKWNQHYDL